MFLLVRFQRKVIPGKMARKTEQICDTEKAVSAGEALVKMRRDC